MYGSIEATIQQFELVMHNRGFDAPIGEAYGSIEGPNGELGYYLVGMETAPCGSLGSPSLLLQLLGFCQDVGRTPTGRLCGRVGFTEHHRRRTGSLRNCHVLDRQTQPHPRDHERTEPYLSDEAKAKYEKDLIPRYPERRLLPILHDLQHHERCIPHQAMVEVAQFLNLTPGEVLDTVLVLRRVPCGTRRTSCGGRVPIRGV